MSTSPLYDVVIIGGGPAGLQAALTVGRARKRVLLADSGTRRNAAAVHMQNFVSRDGTPPMEFRRIAREQLAAKYPNVEVRDVRVDAIAGERGAFEVKPFEGEALQARRVLLCTGLIDELPTSPGGFRELWGKGIYQCPYCHGWEVKGNRWSYLARDLEQFHFAFLLRAWAEDVVVFTNGNVSVPGEMRAKLEKARVRLEERPIVKLVGRDDHFAGVELNDGTTVESDVLFTHPRQRQVELVSRLGLDIDENGFVVVDPMTRETSVKGIYASGDLTTRMQAAVLAAASGMQAAAAINMELTTDLLLGVLRS